MLKITTRGLTEFTNYITSLARNLRGLVTEAITDWLIGNDERGFKHYPPQQGQQYQRTGELKRGWVKTGRGVLAKAENSVPYARFVQGTGTQVWWTKKYNWRSISEIIQTNIKGAIRHAEAAIRMFRK